VSLENGQRASGLPAVGRHALLLVRRVPVGRLVRFLVCPFRWSTRRTRFVVSGPVTRPLPVVKTPAHRPSGSISAKYPPSCSTFAFALAYLRATWRV
jgi:hypothetical protein